MPKKGRPAGRIPKIGEPFGKLTVRSGPVVVKSRSRVWCDCSCGKRVFVKVNALLTGNNKSCGCERRRKLVSRNTKHGATPRGKKRSEYRIWALIIQRCENKKNPSYQNYGARGIRICNRWRNSFEAFLADMGPRPSPRHTIDRYPNNNGDYCPENCRWATRKQQNRNSRHNRKISFRGESLCMSEWAERIGIDQKALRHRLESGWSVELALTTPNLRKP